MALSDSRTGRRPFWRRSGPRPPTNPEPPSLTQTTFPTCRAQYLCGPVQVLVGWRVARSRAVSSLSVLPSPLSGRVGVHIVTFEACSSFTRVTACRVAHPPYVGFIARLRPGQFPGSDARKLPSSTNNLLGWVLPPLVICAAEAHPTIQPFAPYRGSPLESFLCGYLAQLVSATRAPRRENHAGTLPALHPRLCGTHEPEHAQAGFRQGRLIPAIIAVIEAVKVRALTALVVAYGSGQENASAPGGHHHDP